MRFEYPPIEGVEADLLLVTHEHFDHAGMFVPVGGGFTIGTREQPVIAMLEPPA